MNVRLAKLFFIAAFLFSQAGFAQTKREILVEDPRQSPNLIIELCPLNITSNVGENFDAVEYGIRGSYRFNNKFTLSAEFRMEWADATQHYSTYTYGPKAGSTIEVAGTYYFATKEIEKERLLPIKSKAIGNNTVEVTVDPIPVTRLLLYGARAGYINMSNTAPLYSSELVKAGGGSSAPVVNETATPLHTSGMTFVGISATRIQNIKVKYPVYGVRRKQFNRTYFFDVIYSNSSKYSTVKSTDDEMGEEYIVTSTTEMPKVGARIGFFNMSTGKVVNWGWGMELGSLPRTDSFKNGIYYNLRIALPLAFNLNKPAE